MKGTSISNIQVQIAKGWRPNNYLTNMSMAFFQEEGDFVAPSIFPVCPVALSSSYYYTFSKADLARDNVQRKPAFGKVQPEVIVGIDQIDALNYQRAKAPGVADPRRAKVRFVTEQLKLHLDLIFAANFFNPLAWQNVWTGVAANPGANQFLKFNDANFDPVNFFDARIKDIKQAGRRRPNRLALGVDAYNALKNHPDIVERVKYTGSTANPAIVTPQALAAILQIEEVKVLESTYNRGGIGQEDMQFVCATDGALLCYATDNPSIDEPSAGYIFTWDMLGNGQYIAIDQYEGEKGTHAEFIEGLMATDMKKTCDDLAIYFDQCV